MTETPECPCWHCTTLAELRKARKQRKYLYIQLLVLAILLTGSLVLNLYLRAEQLEARRALDKQTDLREAAETSREYWKRKYEVLRARKPLTARQVQLLRRFEAAQVKK